jgi:hypothetical protein
VIGPAGSGSLQSQKGYEVRRCHVRRIQVEREALSLLRKNTDVTRKSNAINGRIHHGTGPTLLPAIDIGKTPAPQTEKRFRQCTAQSDL